MVAGEYTRGSRSQSDALRSIVSRPGLRRKEEAPVWERYHEEPANYLRWHREKQRVLVEPRDLDSLLSEIGDFVGADQDIVQYEEDDDLNAAIEASREMLQWPDDWDGEGSPRYEVSTWERAVAFLRGSAERLSQECGLVADVPRIQPGPNGSIDLHWLTAERELLINFPADPSEPIEFYGDGPPNNMVKGRLPDATPKCWLLRWLAE